MKKILFLIILFNCSKMNLKNFKNINKYPIEDELISAINRADNQDIDEILQSLKNKGINIEELRHENKNIFMIIFEQYGKNCHNPKIKLLDARREFFLNILDKYKQVMEQGFINDMDNEGNSLLFYAIDTGIIELVTNVKNLQVKYLIENHNTENVKKFKTIVSETKASNKLDYFYELCKKDSNSKEVNEILKDLYNSFEDKNEDGETALSIALKNKAYKIARILIEKFEELDYVDRNNSSYFYLTIKNGGLETFSQLLARGNFLESKGKINLKKILEQKNNQENTLLHLSSKEGYIGVVRDLLKNNVPFDEKNEKGETALHKSVKNNRKEIVQVLLENGADINIQDEKYNAPIHYAVLNENVEIIQLIMDRNPDISLKGQENLMPKELTKNLSVLSIFENSSIPKEQKNLKILSANKKETDSNKEFRELVDIILRDLDSKGQEEIENLKKQFLELKTKYKLDQKDKKSIEEAISKISSNIEDLSQVSEESLKAAGIESLENIIRDLKDISEGLKTVLK